jgi:hypothetical protein
MMEKAKCSICEEIIMPDLDGWDGGHNAEPINSGKCCGFCNARIVTPTRIVLCYKKEYPKGEVI